MCGSSRVTGVSPEKSVFCQIKEPSNHFLEPDTKNSLPE